MSVDLRDMSFNDVRKYWLKRKAETFKWRNREFSTTTGKELFGEAPVAEVEEEKEPSVPQIKRGRPKKKKVEQDEVLESS